MNKKRLSNKELVEAIAKLFDEIGPETEEEINQTLRDAGYDPDEVGRRMGRIAQRLLNEVKKNLD